MFLRFNDRISCGGMLVIGRDLLYDTDMDKYKELWPGGALYAGDPVGADSLALADFAGKIKAARICDLGCGCGILLLLLGRGRESTELRGVELRTAAAEQARRNARANGMADRCRIVTGDLRAVPFPAESAELVISNPPYFPAGAGGISPDPDRALMRSETADLGQLCAAAAKLLTPGGAFCLVHRTERMAEVFRALSAAGLEPRRLRLMAAGPKSPPWAFLCEARKGAGPGLAVEPTLLQRGEDGRETREYLQICHWEEQA